MTENIAKDDISALESAARAQRLAIQYYRAGNLRDALTEAIKAADTDQQNTQLQNLVGAISNETADPGTAVRYLRHSLSVDEHQVEAQFLLGNALTALGSYDEAIHAYDLALSMDPNHVYSHINLSQCFGKLKQYNKAEQALHRALYIDPRHPDANIELAEVLIRKTQYDVAEKYARVAVEVSPDRIPPILTLAKALRGLKRFEDAEELYRPALHVHPHDASLLVEIGSTLREQNLFDAAEKHFDSALKLAPRNSKVLHAAAAYFNSIRKFERALDLFEQYRHMKPDDIGVLNNIAILLRDLNKFEEAENAYLECANQSAHPSHIYNNLGIIAMEMGKPRESIEYYRKSLEDNPNYANAHSNMLFYMNYLDDITVEELFEEHRNWAKWHTEPLLSGAEMFANSVDPDRRIKVGYVSADLYGHAVSYFIESALKHHDTSKYEIYCYAHVRTPDGLTKRLQSYDNHWRFITTMDDQEVARMIRDDKIDVLVDLGGHTAGNRLKVFALKPAPIQVTWIGYPNTTGLDTIDYRLVDAITDPEGAADKCHSETLWRLPRSFTCYNPQFDLEPSRILAANDTGQITFGSFNNASKLSAGSIKTWARILNRVEGSRLFLKSPSLIDEGTTKRFHDQFESYGVPAERVEMFGRMDSNSHMNFYANIDIGLDPFPYNGTTTSCEALWMNVPIVTMKGDRHSARVTASLLSQVGLSDLAANDPDEYVETAVELANDRTRLEGIRANLREDMIKSPLCDHEGHTREVEDAYRSMWVKWCDDEPARRKVRVAAGLPELETYKPPLRILHSLGNYSFVQFCKCIGVMGEIYSFNDLHPLGTNLFHPLKIGQQRFELFSEEDWAMLPKKDLTFLEMIQRLHAGVESRGGTLVITDWCHLDYLAQPYLAAPNFELAINDSLENNFELKELFVMRHPLSQWATYCRETNVDVHVTVEEFLRGYRHMAEKSVEGVMIRCEDFAARPDEILKHACDHLEISFDPNYDDNWPFNFDVPPASVNYPLEIRAKERINADMPTDVSTDLVEQMKACADYPIILDLLGYE